MQLYTFQGVTDSVNDCDCCGRNNLKRTMVLTDVTAGDVKYFGTHCGAMALGWSDKKAAKKMTLEFAKKNHKKICQRSNASHLVSNDWGLFFCKEFFPLFDEGALRQDWAGMWRFKTTGASFSSLWAEEAEHERTPFPANVYSYEDFEPEYLRALYAAALA